MHQTRAPLLLVAAVALWPGQVVADEPSNHEKGLAAFKEARALIDQGDCASAIPKLTESLTYEPSVGAHLSLAECSSNDPLTAWGHLKEAEFLTYTKSDHRAAIAHERARTLEPRLALLRIEVPPTALALAGLEVKVDRIAIDRFYYQGGVIAVEPGAHTVDAVAPGLRWSAAAETSVGTTAVVTVRLTADSTPSRLLSPAVKEVPPPATKLAAQVGSGRRARGLVLGGIGVAGLLAGTVTGAISFADATAAKNDCGGRYPMCTNNVQPTNLRAKTFATIADSAFAVGGALTIAGAVLYFSAPSSSSAPPRAGSVPSVQVSATMGSASASLGLFTRW